MDLAQSLPQAIARFVGSTVITLLLCWVEAMGGESSKKYNKNVSKRFAQLSMRKQKRNVQAANETVYRLTFEWLSVTVKVSVTVR